MNDIDVWTCNHMYVILNLYVLCRTVFFFFSCRSTYEYGFAFVFWISQVSVILGRNAVSCETISHIFCTYCTVSFTPNLRVCSNVAWSDRRGTGAQVCSQDCISTLKISHIGVSPFSILRWVSGPCLCVGMSPAVYNYWKVFTVNKGPLGQRPAGHMQMLI